MSAGKHVIFLGAGASYGSGYPLANGLRLLISSRKKWEEAVAQYEAKHNVVSRPIVTMAMSYYDRHREALELFRNGGFATLDEFCKLAGGFSFQREIKGLRSLVRGALGLFNPEEHFEKSEYYGFVQSLFKDDLLSLREDITVLTYNYDPYLEFLLYRALENRFRVTQKDKTYISNEKDLLRLKDYQRSLNAVTSGLFSYEDLSWLSHEPTKPAFCVLKLHGSICYYADEISGFDRLFLTEPQVRADKLFNGDPDRVMPPILFPWEVMTERGFAEQNAFPIQSRVLHTLFQGIWERARRDVQAADKISFVGMSMHPFMFDGLKYLFDGKQGKVEVCVANPDNMQFVRGKAETHWNHQPYSSAYAVAKTLGEIAPKMSRFGMVPGSRRGADGDVTLVQNFSEFIRTQMKPIQKQPPLSAPL
jgi:hypothetical protein